MSIVRPAPAPSACEALVSLALSVLLSSLGTSITNVALPTIAHGFAVTFQEVQWVVLAYLLAVTTAIVGVGRLGDVIGRRRLLLAGITLFTAATAFCAAAPTLWLLVAARASQGLGAAVMMSLSMAMVADTVPKAKTGRAMGLLGTMSAIGTALGPSLGGILIAGLGWRSIFLINLPLGVATYLLARRQLPRGSLAPASERRGFDAVGTLLLGLTLSASALALTIGRGSFGSLNLCLLLAAAMGITLFSFVEKRAASPLIQPGMFRNSALGANLLANALVSTVLMATLVVGPFYLTYGLGLDAASVGFSLSVGPLVAAATGVPAGRATDAFGAQRLTIAGLLAIACGCSMLALLPVTSGIGGYVAPMVIITLGYAAFQTANNSVVMMHVAPEERGVTSGMINLSRNLGLLSGASLMGAVFALGSGATEISSARPEAVTAGMRITFAVAAALIIAALAAVLGARVLARRAPIAGRA